MLGWVVGLFEVCGGMTIVDSLFYGLSFLLFCFGRFFYRVVQEAGFWFPRARARAYFVLNHVTAGKSNV